MSQNYLTEKQIIDYITECGEAGGVGRVYRLFDKLSVEQMTDVVVREGCRYDGRTLTRVPFDRVTKEWVGLALMNNVTMMIDVNNMGLMHFVDQDLCEQLVKKFPKKLDHIPSEFRNETVCQLAMQASGNLFGFVPESLMTQELFDLAAQTSHSPAYCDKARHLINETNARVLVENRSQVIELIPAHFSNYADLLLSAIGDDSSNLQYSRLPNHDLLGSNQLDAWHKVVEALNKAEKRSNKRSEYIANFLNNQLLTPLLIEVVGIDKISDPDKIDQLKILCEGLSALRVNVEALDTFLATHMKYLLEQKDTLDRAIDHLLDQSEDEGLSFNEIRQRIEQRFKLRRRQTLNTGSEFSL